MSITLKNVRLAFSRDLFKAGSMNEGENPTFSSTFLIPKDDPQNKMISDEIARVAKEKWAAKAEINLKALYAGDRVCHKDGDLKPDFDGFAGCMSLKSSNKVAPTVIDRDRSKLTESSGRPYAGCYVNANVEIWAQDNGFGKRINAVLRGVQFVRDGDAFTGAPPASADEFEDIAMDHDDLA